MTKNELSDLYFLNREIDEIKKRIGDIKYKVKFLKEFVSEDEINFGDELEELSDMLVTSQKKCFKQQLKLEKFIKDAPSSEIRTILAYRYVNGLSWQQIAFSIGEHDESYARKKHDAYLRKERKKCGGKIKI